MHTKGPNHCMPTATNRTSRDPYGHGSRSASPHLPRSLASMPNAWSNKVLAGVGGGSTASKTHEAKAELALGYFYSQLFFCIGRVTTKSPAAYPTCLPGQFIFQGLRKQRHHGISGLRGALFQCMLAFEREREK